MKTKISTKKLIARYPNAVSVLTKKFIEAKVDRKLKSLSEKTIADIEFSLHWFTRLQGYSGADVFSGKAQFGRNKENVLEAKTADEITDDYIRQKHEGIHGGTIQATCGRWWDSEFLDGCNQEPFSGHTWTAEQIPQEIIE